MIHQTLAKELVEAKKKKLNCLSRLYLWLQDTFVQKILFKNTQDELNTIVAAQSKGEVHVPSELERVMHEEALEIIRNKYDHADGSREIQNLIRKQKKKKSLLNLTDLDKQIKLVHMSRTFEFTRPLAMLQRLMETIFYMIISNTQGMVYFGMILSMYINAGVLSLVYPFLVFGYALLEENRPRKEFWNFVRSYTTVLLFIKFVVNLSVLDVLLTSKLFLDISVTIKLGIYKYEEFWKNVMYMCPEVVIIAFIMLNEIQLRLIGLYHEIEEDVETIEDAIQRNIEHGDATKVAQKKVQKANMQLTKYFKPLRDQLHERQQQLQEELLAK